MKSKEYQAMVANVTTASKYLMRKFFMQVSFVPDSIRSSSTNQVKGDHLCFGGLCKRWLRIRVCLKTKKGRTLCEGALPCRTFGAEERWLGVSSSARYACQTCKTSAKEQHGGRFRDWRCFFITS